MSVPLYDSEDLHRKVQVALRALFCKDDDLLRRDANERSITHKLAEHLQSQFEHLAVDCEYNRHGDNAKRLASILHPEEHGSDCTDARTVYPDIIAHERGSDLSNAMVIEVKKSTGEDTNRDRRKLRMFTSPFDPDEFSYGYSLGMLLVFDVGRRRLKHVECYQHGESQRRQCTYCRMLVKEFAKGTKTPPN